MLVGDARHPETDFILRLSALVALAAAASAALLSRVSGERFASFVVLTIALAPFGHHMLRDATELGASAAWLASFACVAPFAALGAVAPLSVAVGLSLASALALGIAMPPPASEGAKADATEGAKLPDIVLLVMDTTRPDHLSPYGYSEETTPNLRHFAEGAELFSNAWSPAPWTAPSHASMFTGLLPAEHGVDGQPSPELPATLAVLPDVLARAGYRTAAYVANPNLTGAGWDRGFASFRAPWSLSSHTWARVANLSLRRKWGWGARDATPRLLRSAREWWREGASAPRFLFINVIDPHQPFEASDEYAAKFLDKTERKAARAVRQDPVWTYLGEGVTDREAELLGRLYDAELSYLDAELGRFFDWFEARDELDSTLFVITSDHGERLGERGMLGHEMFMDGNLLRVPLLVRFPGHVAAKRQVRIVQTQGLPGYILHLAGVEAPSAIAASALHSRREDVAIAQYLASEEILGMVEHRDPNFDIEPFRSPEMLATDGRYFWVRRSHEPEVGRLYDGESDPDWRKDLAAEQPALAAELRAAAARLPEYRERAPAQLDDGQRELLKALGYVD